MLERAASNQELSQGRHVIRTPTSADNCPRPGRTCGGLDAGREPSASRRKNHRADDLLRAQARRGLIPGRGLTEGQVPGGRLLQQIGQVRGELAAHEG